MHLNDEFGRSFKYLRLSVTEACNFRCSYCLPNGYRKSAGPQPLKLDEIRRIATAFSELGVHKIRLTGGEPTIRRDFDAIAATIAALPQVNKLALTTNGYRLATRAQTWFDAGVRSLNVSLDSLDPVRFHQITGHDRCDQVLRGIDAALEAGFHQVKINAVYMKGINDHEIDAYLRLAQHQPLSVRFIELMETGDHASFFKEHHVSTDNVANKLLREGWTAKLKAADAGPANDFIHSEYQGSIGLIAPYAKDFCKSCNRLRFSSLGKLHLCLFGEFGVPMRAFLQSDDQLDELKERLMVAVKGKTASHKLVAGNTGQTSNLSAIGG